MPEPVISDIARVLAARDLPTVTMWNRVEGRPRTHDFKRALQATIHDPLWFLTRQWQMGEFRGDDAGSPVFAKIATSTAAIEAYQPANHDAEPFDEVVPLEARVERRPIPFEWEGQAVALDIRLLMGRHWLKLMRAVGDFRDEFVRAYPIRLPDPTDPADAAVCAHPDAWQHLAAVAGRAVDGYTLYRHLKDGGAAHDGTTIPAGSHADVAELAERFVAWFEALFYQPSDDGRGDAWRPNYLEYQFSLSAPDASGRSVLHAEGYHHGRLDWYSVDIDPTRDALPVPGEPAEPNPGDPDRPGPLAPRVDVELSRDVVSFIPVGLSFEGMPHSRWWTFEDARTSFGDVHSGTKDLAKLMLIEFGLVYANDWFLFPLPLPAGTSSRIDGLAVTNVFGERFWIDAAGRGSDQDWERWSMFTLDIMGTGQLAADTRFVLLPTVPKIQEGAPLEDVLLVRDEMANMVWGIESRVPLAHGRSRPGYEVAVETRAFHQRLVADASVVLPPAAAPVRYRVMSNDVPENRIPFIPVHVPDDNREIQLQRAALPRLIPGDPNPPVKIRPRTASLGPGRAEGAAYFVHEEEVPRAGVRVAQSFQRTRWHRGRVVTWLGAQKHTGRGEGSNNLRFDYLAPANEAP